MGFSSFQSLPCLDICRGPSTTQLAVGALPFRHVVSSRGSQRSSTGAASASASRAEPAPQGQRWILPFPLAHLGLSPLLALWLSSSPPAISAPGLFPFRVLELGQQLPLMATGARAVGVGGSFSLGPTFPTSPNWWSRRRRKHGQRRYVRLGPACTWLGAEGWAAQKGQSAEVTPTSEQHSPLAVYSCIE